MQPKPKPKPKPKTPAMPPVDVFVSFARPEFSFFGGALRRKLEELGVVCFPNRPPPALDDLDHEEIVAIESASVAVFILSPEFAAGRRTMKALRRFLHRSREVTQTGTSPPRLIPVFFRLSVQECRNFNPKRYVNANGRNVFDAKNFYSEERQKEVAMNMVRHELREISEFPGIENEGVGNFSTNESENFARDALLNRISQSMKFPPQPTSAFFTSMQPPMFSRKRPRFVTDIDVLLSEMEKIISTFSEDALSRLESAVLPMSQEERIHARGMRENLLASHAMLKVDQSLESIEKARNEMNASRRTSLMLKCMGGDLLLAPANTDMLANTVASILAKYQGQDPLDMPEYDIDELMAASTVGDIIEEVRKDSSEYGSCLVRQTERPKMIRTELELMQKIGYKLVTFKGRTHLEHRTHLLEIGDVNEVAGDFFMHLNGNVFTNPNSAAPKYEVQLDGTAKVYVMGGMTMKKLMKEADNQIQNTERARSLMDIRCMQLWVGHGTSLITSSERVVIRGLRALSKITMLAIRDSSYKQKTLYAPLTWRAGVNISMQPGAHFEEEKTFDDSVPFEDAKERFFDDAYAREHLRRGYSVKRGEFVSCSDLRNAWIMMNNYFQSSSGDVRNEKACAYKYTCRGKTDVNVAGTTWRAARLAGWVVEEEQLYALSPHGEEYALQLQDSAEAFDHVSHCPRVVYMKRGSRDDRVVAEGPQYGTSGLFPNKIST